MAKTTFATNDSLTKKMWEEKLYRDVVKESYFMSKFAGENKDSLVQVNRQLEKSQGDNVTFGIRMRLTGSGVTAGEVLEGKEEKLTTYNFNVSLQQYRHGVRDNGAMDRKRPMFSIDSESEQAIKDWSSEKIDQLLFDQINVVTYTKKFYGGDATSTATLETADKLTPALISKIRSWAITGGARTYVPLRPVRVEGKNLFVLLVSPDVAYDLKQDSTFTQAMREALPRAVDHPLFTDALGMWDGVVIHEHENVLNYTTGGSGGNVPYSLCHFMGAQSLVWAWGSRPKVTQKMFDYDNEHGFSIDWLSASGKPYFNSLGYGSVALYVARTNIAGA